MSKTYQARPAWDLERSIRRAALRRSALIVASGLALFAFGYLFLVILFTS